MPYHIITVRVKHFSLHFVWLSSALIHYILLLLLFISIDFMISAKLFHSLSTAILNSEHWTLFNALNFKLLGFFAFPSYGTSNYFFLLMTRKKSFTDTPRLGFFSRLQKIFLQNQANLNDNVRIEYTVHSVCFFLLIFGTKLRLMMIIM